MERVSADGFKGFLPGDGTNGVMSERPCFFHSSNLRRVIPFHSVVKKNENINIDAAEMMLVLKVFALAGGRGRGVGGEGRGRGVIGDGARARG